MNGLKSTPAQRWLARLSFSLAGLAIVIVVVVAGLRYLAGISDWGTPRPGHRIDRR